MGGNFLGGFWDILGLQYFTPGHILMILAGLVLIYLAIGKKYEPLLLLPIGFGAILTNIPIRDTLDCQASVVSNDPRTHLEFVIQLPPEGVKFDGFLLLGESSGDFRADVEDVKVMTTEHSGRKSFQKSDVMITGLKLKLPVEIYQLVKVRLRVLSGSLDLTGVKLFRHSGLMDPGGLLYILYHLGVTNGLFPLLIFLGIGSLTDFGPLLANPKTALLGGAAQFGIFTTLLGALSLNYFGIGFTMKEAASIGIIGGADGPTSIYVASKMADHLLGAIAIAAYSYMALVPIIQPPIMRLLTSERERSIKMEQLKPISKRTRIMFPIGATLLCAMLVPSATPLIGMIMLGNLMRESGVVERITYTSQNELINIVTIFLGISVGGKMDAASFLTVSTISILFLGLLAFMVGTASGVILGKIMNVLSGGRINPLIGAAGVSAVPMAARVVEVEGQKANPDNHLLMHAMGPNVAGVIGSAVAAGYFLSVIH